MSAQARAGNAMSLSKFNKSMRTMLNIVSMKEWRKRRALRHQPVQPQPEFSELCHSLRTPLNAIIGFSEMMSAQIYGPLGHNKYQDYSTAIAKSGQELLLQIEAILNEKAFQAEAQNDEISKTIARASCSLKTLAAAQTMPYTQGLHSANSNTVH